MIIGCGETPTPGTKNTISGTPAGIPPTPPDAQKKMMQQAQGGAMQNAGKNGPPAGYPQPAGS
jgi:hypothetical protein